MKRILILSEFSELSTGYSTYCRELLKGLYSTGKYDLLELACYGDPKDSRIYNQPWKVVPILPNSDNSHEVDIYKSNQLNTFGLWKFDQVSLQFKPHIVISIRDFWMDQYIDFSSSRRMFNWLWLITVDGINQNEEWLDVYSRVDGLFTYNDWSKQQIEKESNNNLKIINSVPQPICDLFQPGNTKSEFGLEGKFIFGAVMRNQKRKLFPALFNAFRKYLDKTNKDTLLYCHTSYPDQAGWDIPKLLLHLGLSSRVLFSYVCRECGFFFPAFFSDSLTACKKCGNLTATLANVSHGISTENLVKIYQLMDVYLQIASNEGLGISQLEAAACAVPVMSTDYSAMQDVVRKLNGWPIKVISTPMEIETGRLLAVPDEDFLTEKMLEASRLNNDELNRWKELSLEGFKKYYNRDEILSRWINHIDTIDENIYEQMWRSPPRFKQIPTQIPDINHRAFVRWLITDVLQEPNRLDSYFELKLLRQLNHGIGTHNPYTNFMDDVSYGNKMNFKKFTKEDAFHFCKQVTEAYNQFERLRTHA